MSDPKQGRYASVKIATTLIQNIGSWKLNIGLDTIDVTVLGSVWKKMITGMQGWTATIDGFYDPGDTVGQLLLHNSALSATKITTLKLYVDSTSAWQPDITGDSAAGCYISSMDLAVDKAGCVTCSMQILGFGPIKIY